jgi:hypothetical protein
MIALAARGFLTAPLVIASITTNALAGTAEIPPGQQPPKDDAQQAPPQERKCVVNNADFTPNKTFMIELTNTCEQRYRCTVRAYIVNAAGPTRGEATLTLEPASKGADARKVYVIRLKESYGQANSSQSCEAL